MRISELVLYKGWSDNEDLITYVSMAVLCVIGIIPCFVVAKKNIVKRELPNLFNIRTEDFCLKAIPVYFFVTAVLYFVLGDSAIYFTVPFAEMKSFASSVGMIRSGEILIPAIMVVSFIVFNLLYLSVSKKAIKKK